MSTNHQLQHNDILQNRMGLRIAARLSAGAGEVSHDVSERLRVARQQALARRKRPQMVARNAAADAPVVLQQGPTAVLGFGGGDRLGFWGRAGSAFLRGQGISARFFFTLSSAVINISHRTSLVFSSQLTKPWCRSRQR